jgi:hypothetical protein
MRLGFTIGRDQGRAIAAVFHQTRFPLTLSLSLRERGRRQFDEDSTAAQCPGRLAACPTLPGQRAGLLRSLLGLSVCIGFGAQWFTWNSVLVSKAQRSCFRPPLPGCAFR